MKMRQGDCIFYCILSFQLINQINLAVCFTLEIEASVFLLIAVLHVNKDHWPAEGERDVMHFLSSPAIKQIFEAASDAPALPGGECSSTRWRAYWLPFHALFIANSL